MLAHLSASDNIIDTFFASLMVQSTGFLFLMVYVQINLVHKSQSNLSNKDVLYTIGP